MAKIKPIRNEDTPLTMDTAAGKRTVKHGACSGFQEFHHVLENLLPIHLYLVDVIRDLGNAGKEPFHLILHPCKKQGDTGLKGHERLEQLGRDHKRDKEQDAGYQQDRDNQADRPP